MENGNKTETKDRTSQKATEDRGDSNAKLLEIKTQKHMVISTTVTTVAFIVCVCERERDYSQSQFSLYDLFDNMATSITLALTRSG